MTQDIETRSGLPQDMQTLLRTLPRDGWQAHPNFTRSIRNWMGAHQGFRQIAGQVQRDSEAFLDHRIGDTAYADRLAHLGHLLVRNLHSHHGWEDHSFFPELAAADPRFATGLEMLESDHVALDALLDRFSRTGNRVVQLATLDASQMAQEAQGLRETAERLRGFLERHLTDEEDLVVPILLHHALRG
jgi:hypothetical protein